MKRSEALRLLANYLDDYRDNGKTVFDFMDFIEDKIGMLPPFSDEMYKKAHYEGGGTGRQWEPENE